MRRIVGLIALLASWTAGCAPRVAREAPPPAGNRLPPIPARSGPLAITLVHPAEGDAIPVDSTFVFGNVGTGGASLTIDGTPVPVEANGAFLAFLPVPRDGVYRLAASASGRSVQLTRTVKVPGAPAPAAAGALSVVPGSLTPRGAFLRVQDEPMTVRVRATPGATARLVLPGGASYPLVEQRATERAQGFMLERTTQASGVSEYVGSFPARGIAPDSAHVELVRGADTLRLPLDLALRVLPPGAVRVGVAASDRADATVTATAVPGSGTPYNWFFPNGTRLAIDGQGAGQYRVRLTSDLSVWVDTADVRLLPVGTPAPVGDVGTVRAVRQPGFVDVRLFTSERLPFRVDPSDSGLVVTVYDAKTRTNWLQYGATDTLIRRMAWEQASDDVYRLRVELTRPFWGYLAFFDPAGNLVVRIRRPPDIDPLHPLRGRYIAVDAGHPPGGAIGPTELTEADANLAIARRLAALLRQAGARVLETRPDTAAVALGARPLMATDSSVDLLVSVHNNAFPEGVNPFENNGTSAFYNQPQSLELARALQRELIGELGLRDLGVARADLALVRPTWFPSALTETMFLMIPQQEAALRDPEVQERIARAHVRAIEEFLRRRGR
ncbi:MAG TPA: N-acetylmuramoyl-L-alanine amidase [Longimicrobiaceae bacterium]|nr:N-acetylmuramoyl-L-alanine amidase [Longimicrobiaceae bacterium]